jgi:hypothetical protein
LDTNVSEGCNASIFKPEDVLPKRRYTPTSSHGITTQKININRDNMSGSLENHESKLNTKWSFKIIGYLMLSNGIYSRTFIAGATKSF